NRVSPPLLVESAGASRFLTDRSRRHLSRCKACICRWCPI
ncbi:unnamed protein product, partial [Brassica rapa]